MGNHHHKQIPPAQLQYAVGGTRHAQNVHVPSSTASGTSRIAAPGDVKTDGYNVNKPNLTLRPEGGSSSDSESSGSENEAENSNPSSSNQHPRMIQKIHYSQISHCTNTTQERPQPVQYHPTSHYHTDTRTTCIMHDVSTGREVVQLVHPSHATSQPQKTHSNQQYEDHQHQQKRYDQQIHHQHQQYVHQQQHQNERSRASQSQPQSHAGFLTLFRARCQSIVGSLSRTPQVAAP